MTFIHDGFLLHSEAARRLYLEHAAGQPVFDYHSHLPPADIASDRQFRNLFEIWLEGDHYKWRAMRANGIPEMYCTGDAGPVREVQGVGATVPRCLRNPLYHWTHLELKRYFDIDELLDESSADRDLAAGERAAASRRNCRPAASSRKFGVQVLCTTDDPADDAREPRSHSAANIGTRGLPDVPARPRARRPPAGGVQSVGGPARGPHQHRHLPFLASAGRPAQAARRLPRRRRPPVGPWSLPLPGHALERVDRRRDFRQGPRRPGGQPARNRRLLGADDALLRAARRGEGLDETAAPRRAAQCQHPRLRVVGPRHRVRLDRRLASGRCAGCLPRSTGPGERATEDHRLQRQPG